jgi:hypothetical protein
LLNLSGVGLMVEDATGLKTQVTMRRSLDERMAQRIADDLIEVFWRAADLGRSLASRPRRDQRHKSNVRE